MNELSRGKLDQACCYLSGAMEYAADSGVSWRRQFMKMIWDKGLNIDFIDPTNKPGGEDIKLGEDKEYQVKLQKEGKYLELRDYVSKYRRFDLRFVDLSDFLVVVIDPNIHLCGTYNEVFLAEQQHKPCFFVCDGGLSKLPRWLYDVVDLEDSQKQTRCNVFGSLEEVVEELLKIDSGEVKMSNKWVLIRKYLEHIRLQNPNRLQFTF